MATYYVSTTGNDLAAGTIGAPWATIQHACTTMQQGDTTYIRAGTYTENTLTFGNSGASGSPITILAYPGESVTIDAARTTATGRIPVFDLDGVSYITIGGQAGGTLTITRGDTANIYLGYNNASTTHDITIQYCTISNYVVNDNSAQIYLNNGVNNITVQRNYLTGAQSLPAGLSNAAGIIAFNTHDVTITNNEVSGVDKGIYFKHNSAANYNVVISYNLIHDCNDYGILLTKDHATISHNVIYNISNTGMGIQIYEQSASCGSLITDHVTVSHNTIHTPAGIYINNDGGTLGVDACTGAVNCTIIDNIVYRASDSWQRGIGVWLGRASDVSSTTIKYCLVDPTTLAQPVRVTNSGSTYTATTMPMSILDQTGMVSASPTFVDAAAHNYTLTAASAGYQAASDGTDMGANFALVGVGNGGAARFAIFLR